MEPYYGRHSIKQFIKGKPIRYGFKFWVLTTGGYVLKFMPYCGAGDKIEGKSLGSSVTESLCLGYIPANSTVYIDNFFNSLSLLQELGKNKINCIGTIRADRIQKVSLQDLRNAIRGVTHTLQNPDYITLTRWKDNNQVTIGTNVQSDDVCLTKGLCKRWSRQLHKHVDVDEPSVIHLYNQGMGGVDLFDNMRGLYRIRIRSRKWYWPLVRFCLNTAVVNSWLLYRYAYPSTSLLDYTRKIILSRLTAPEYLNGPKPKRRLTAPEYLNGPKPKRSKNVLHEIRYDKIDHLIDQQNTQRRCAFCGKCAKFSCGKCNVGLHPKTCFRVYHTPPQ
ncbi:Transposase IS4 [Popillia japonica]|uniref:Transposase IS4 n=1 Tax=Popillia japonica TaxID=7064 RepID=A0AAW1LBF1_POPJA